MALEATFRTLGKWPGKETPSYSRKRAAFRIGYADRLNLLEHELSKLNAKGIVIQAQFEPKDIRNDGWPRSSARPKGPAIIANFNGAKGALSFPCDRYQAWYDNLYAIALSLEALRAVDRHGVTQNAEQYRGWTQLPPPAPSGAPFANRHEAALWLAAHAVVPKDYILGNAQAADLAYRSAAKKLHPDAGGSTVEFQKLGEAIRLIRGEGK